MTLCGRIPRRVRWLALGLVVCGGVAGLAGATAAAEDRVQYASAAEVLDLGTPTLSDGELSEQRGTGLEAEVLLLSDSGDDLAVILWDEFKRPNGSTWDSGTQTGSVTISD